VAIALSFSLALEGLGLETVSRRLLTSRSRLGLGIIHLIYTERQSSNLQPSWSHIEANSTSKLLSHSNDCFETGLNISVENRELLSVSSYEHRLTLALIKLSVMDVTIELVCINFCFGNN